MATQEPTGNIQQCKRAAGHDGDCRVRFRGKNYSVSPKGYDDHPPVLASK
ncbi:MAG TPA: hypothetical protein VGO67_17840 [Verrucomicrobiae bacterium]|jgi:hypothetical protein